MGKSPALPASGRRCVVDRSSFRSFSADLVLVVVIALNCDQLISICMFSWMTFFSSSRFFLAFRGRDFGLFVQFVASLDRGDLVSMAIVRICLFDSGPS